MIASSALAATLPADIAVYGEQPATFRNDVTPFPPSGSIFTFQQDADDPVTRLKYTTVSGFQNGLGRYTHRISTFGKYVILGNGETASIGGNATDFRVGVFDTETKTYCDLIIDPTIPASIPQVVTGNSGARQTRIVLAPGSTTVGGPIFGYIAGDLDATSPCTTWPVVLATAADLNAGYTVDNQICPNGSCAFDTVALLAHEDVVGDPFGRDYVILGEYFSNHSAVVRVDASGITTVATYHIPLFATPGSGGACYSSGPARLPATDVQSPDARPVNDWRFLVSFDSFLVQFYPTSSPPAACAAPYSYCPRDVAGDGLPGAACPGSGSCAQGYCAKSNAFTGWMSCTTNANCNFFGADTGPCQTTCLPKSPLYVCKTANGGGSHRQCSTLNPSSCPSGETCSASPQGIVGPAQEYRFDKTTNTITPTSGMFFLANTNGTFNGVSPTSVAYASDRSVWVHAASPNAAFYATHASTDNCTVDGQTVHVPTGEHCYYNPANPSTASIIPADVTMSFEITPAIPYEATSVQLGGQMFYTDAGSLQYAQAYVGTWFTVDDTSYKVAWAYAPPYVPVTDPSMASALPIEPKRCSVSLLGCNVDADCAPSGGTCTAVAEADACVGPACPVKIFGQKKFIEVGGSPKSLWVTNGYPAGPPVAQMDVFLERVPVQTPVPDVLNTSRPSIGWSGGDCTAHPRQCRLWMAAFKDGGMKVRVRDDGVWSSWLALPTNVATTGGPAIIANANTVTVIGRGTNGQVYVSYMTSPITCTLGTDCTFANWGQVGTLPAGVTATGDVNASYTPNNWYIAVRGSNEKVYYVYVFGLQYAPWVGINNLVTDTSPAVAYNPVDGKVWIAAKEKTTGIIKRTRATFASYEAWVQVGATPYPSTGAWGKPPAMVSDGSVMHVFVSQNAFPQTTWQTIDDGTGFGDWRAVPSGGGSTVQDAAANVNGTVNLVSDWIVGSTYNMNEQAIE